MPPIPRVLAKVALVLGLTLSAGAHAEITGTCGMPSPGEDGDLSLSALAQKPASLLTCAAGYWAEKCGDHATAHQIHDKCIAAGYAGAMIWKALMLEDGAGVAPDPVAATALLHRATASADAGYATLAKLHYASNLYRGVGVEKDEAEARKWFEAAAAEGSEDAREFLRTGHHTAVRDLSGRGVGTPATEVAGQRLLKVAITPLAGMPAWLAAALALTFVAGVLRQAGVGREPRRLGQAAA
jgi:hypothetical protein